MERAHQIRAFAAWNGRDILLPAVREQRVRALLVEPVDFPFAQHEDAAQHQLVTRAPGALRA